MCGWYSRAGRNVSTTPIMAIGCWQCLPLSDIQLKGKHCHIGSSQVTMMQIMYLLLALLSHIHSIYLLVLLYTQVYSMFMI